MDGFALPAEFNIVFERAGEVTVRLDFQSGLVKRVALEATGDTQSAQLWVKRARDRGLL